MKSVRRHAIVRALTARPLLSLVGAFAVVIVVVCTVNASGRIGKLFPGFFVWDNGFVPAVGESYWTGASAGLQYHSWLVEADGQPVHDQRKLTEILAERRAGDPVRYTLAKDGRRYTIEADLMHMDGRAWVSVLGIYVFNAVMLLMLGLTVLYMQPRDPAAGALFLFCVTLASYLATATDLFGASLFRVPYFFFINLVPVSVLNLLSRFPVDRQRKVWEDRALTGMLALGLILGVTTNVAYDRSPGLLMLLDRLMHFMLAASGLAAIAFFSWYFIVSRTRLVRNRLKVVLWGTFGAFLLPVVMLALVYGWRVSFPLNLLTVFFVLFPISIGYAIARHDLFNIDRLIKRTLVYFALSALVVGLYTATITAMEVLFDNLTEVASRFVQAALILLLVLITAPSRARIQDVVDRIYDRRRYNYRDVVRSASRAFTRILDFEELVRTVLDLIDETLQPESACVYTVTAGAVPHPRGRLVHESGGMRSIDIDVDASHALDAVAVLELLRESDVVVAAEQIDPSAHAARPAAGIAGSLELEPALRAVDASLATAMRLEGRLVGMITVGRKRTGWPHHADDVELLRTISDQLAVALENAQAYKHIDRLNRDLETNYQELERTHQELTAAQAQLVSKERLAAIGELAGAVAHAIRNPLAGIKAAAQLAQLELGDDPASSSVADVISETDRLNERIGALLDFSKPFEPDQRPASLNDIAGRAVHGTEQKAARKGVALEFVAAEELPLVCVDPVLFEEAAAELISNAIEITPVEGMVTVRTGCSENGGTPGPRQSSDHRTVWLEVIDTGPGIRPDKRDRLFDIFFTTKPGGTGFGLATVKKIVERHGGTVKADNVKPNGASFRIELPANSDDDPGGAGPVEWPARSAG